MNAKKEEAPPQVYFSVVDGLKKLYNKKILPVETMYSYNYSASALS